MSIAACGAAAAAQTGEPTKADLKALADIAVAAEAGNCDRVLKRAGPLVERRRQVLPADFTASLYELMAACHLEAKRLD